MDLINQGSGRSDWSDRACGEQGVQLSLLTSPAGAAGAETLPGTWRERVSVEERSVRRRLLSSPAGCSGRATARSRVSCKRASTSATTGRTTPEACRFRSRLRAGHSMPAWLMARMIPGGPVDWLVWRRGTGGGAAMGGAGRRVEGDSRRRASHGTARHRLLTFSPP